MTPTRLVLAVCLLLLGGCTLASRQAPFPRHYVLSAATATAPPAAEPRAAHGSLRIARIVAPPWLQGTGLYYRLDYRHDHGIAAYADSDWIASPARMLEPVIQQALAAAGEWRVVVGPDSPARTDLGLQIRLDDFSQAFAGPAQSRGVIDASAALIDNRDDSVVAQRHFHLEAAAPSANAAGGVAALNEVSRRFAASLQQWLSANAPIIRVSHPPAEQ